MADRSGSVQIFTVFLLCKAIVLQYYLKHLIQDLQNKPVPPGFYSLKFKVFNSGFKQTDFPTN